MDTAIIIGIVFLVVGALAVLLEIQTLTIYLLVLAVGLFVSAGLILSRVNLELSLIALAIVLILGFPAAHWCRMKLKNKAADKIAHDDVGNPVTVVSVCDEVLRVNYRGSTWDACFENPSNTVPAAGDTLLITARRGNQLVVTAENSSTIKDVL